MTEALHLLVTRTSQIPYHPGLAPPDACVFGEGTPGTNRPNAMKLGGPYSGGSASDDQSGSGRVGRAVRPRRSVQQSRRALSEVAIAPLAHGLGVDLEPVRGGFDRPAVLKDTGDHPPPTFWGQRRVRVLTPSVRYEPSGFGCEFWKTHSLTRRAQLAGGSPHPSPTGTTSPLVTVSQPACRDKGLRRIRPRAWQATMGLNRRSRCPISGPVHRSGVRARHHRSRSHR